MPRDREACGRCSLSTAVDVANSGQEDGEPAARDPYGDARIEVDERELRLVSPAAWLAGFATRAGGVVDRLTWGRSESQE